MKKPNPFFFIILYTFILSCGSKTHTEKKYFSIKTEKDNGKFQLGETLKAKIENKKNKKIDSVSFYLNDQQLKTIDNYSIQEMIDQERLGNQILKAIVYYGEKEEEVFKKIVFLNNVAPKLYSYEIIAEYPHDTAAFTQGLEFQNDTLYESTGRKNGLSSLRKTNYLTGEILEKKEIDIQYFAEGITIMNNKIYQLTWQSKVGFIYDLKTLEKTSEFSYYKSKEGWGLCNDGSKVYKSDGTEKIWTLNATTLAEENYIEITTDKSVKSKFNELEWVEGKIFANTWHKDGIAIINPKNGALEAVINLSGLRDKLTQSENLNVLNGIAYKKDTKQLYVTGKNWDKLFEIKIVKSGF